MESKEQTFESLLLELETMLEDEEAIESEKALDKAEELYNLFYSNKITVANWEQVARYNIALERMGNFGFSSMSILLDDVVDKNSNLQSTYTEYHEATKKLRMQYEVSQDKKI